MSPSSFCKSCPYHLTAAALFFQQVQQQPTFALILLCFFDLSASLYTWLLSLLFQSLIISLLFFSNTMFRSRVVLPILHIFDALYFSSLICLGVYVLACYFYEEHTFAYPQLQFKTGVVYVFLSRLAPLEPFRFSEAGSPRAVLRRFLLQRQPGIGNQVDKERLYIAPQLLKGTTPPEPLIVVFANYYGQISL